MKIKFWAKGKKGIDEKIVIFGCRLEEDEILHEMDCWIKKFPNALIGEGYYEWGYEILS